jgi:hypothetical protein
MDEQANKARAAIDQREAEILTELLRLLRTDAEIMETVRDMVRAAGEEAARRPAVLLQTPAVGAHENELFGAQVSGSSVFGQLLELVKDEKDFVQGLITKILRI